MNLFEEAKNFFVKSESPSNQEASTTNPITPEVKQGGEANAKIQEKEKEADVSQKELDWANPIKSSLNDEQLEDILKYKSLKDFVHSGYLKNKKSVIGQITKYDGKDDFETWLKTSVGDVNYQEDNPYKSIGKKYNLPEPFLKRVTEEYKDQYLKSESQKLKESRANKFAQISKKYGTQEHQDNLGALANFLGYNSKQFQEFLGDRILDANTIEQMSKIGSNLRKEPTVRVREGKATGGLPSDLRSLNTLHHRYIKARVSAKTDADRLVIDEKLRNVEAKMRNAFANKSRVS